MRKHLLLLLWLALLPLAGWGQTANTGLKWTGSAQQLVTWTGGGTHYYAVNTTGSKPDRDDASTTVPTGTAVNTYHVWCASHTGTGGLSNSEWNNATHLTVTIDKAYPVVTLYGFQVPYSDSWTEPDVNTMPASSYAFDAVGTNLTWNGIRNNLTWSRSSTSHDVGEYGYTLTVGSALTNNNYEVKVNPQGSLEITAVDGTWTTTPAGKATGVTAKYDGTDKTVADLIATPAVYSGGTVEYSLDGLAWSEDLSTIVVGKDAGTYPVQYRGNGDKNHNDFAGSTFNVFIDQYEIVAGTDFTAPTAKTDGVYTGSAQAIAIAGEFKGKFAEELTAAGAKFIYPTADALPQQTDANENYSFSWNIDLGTSTNFSYGAGATTVTGAKIAKATIASTDYTLPEAVQDLVYNNTDLTLHTPLVWNVTPAPGVAHYNRSDVTDWPTTLRYRNIAGDWTISTAIVPDDNHTFEAGSYISTVTIGGQTAYVVQNDLAVSIAKRAITASLGTVLTSEYDGDPKVLVTAPTFTGVGGVTVPGTVTYTWNDGTEDKTATNVAEVVATNAGEYAITYTFTPATTGIGPNYLPITEPQELGGADAVAEITKAELNLGIDSWTADWADGTTYTWEDIVNNLVTSGNYKNADDEANQAAILAAGLTMTVNGGPADNTNEDFVALLAGDAGIYEIVIAEVADADINYDIKAWNHVVNVTINRIDATLAVLADAEKTYNGDPQDLVTITTAAVGADKVMYIVGGDTAPEADSEAWAEGIPQETDANTYNVWQKVVGDKNHNDVVAAAAVVGTIAPKNIADAVFTIAPATSAYTGDNQNETVIAVVPDDAEPMDVDEDIKSITLPADVTTFGEYDVTIEGQGNYTGTTIKKFNITQAENNAVVTIEGWTYGEYDAEVNAPVLTAAFGAETVQYTYSVKDADDWKDEIPTDFGDYTVKATIAETADYAGVVATENFSIAKANVTDIVAPAAISRTFNGEDQILVEAAKFNDGVKKGDFTYAVVAKGATPADEDYAAALPTGFNAGKYDIYTKFTPDINHNAKDVTPNPVTAEIKQAIVGYALSNLTKTWDGEKIEGDDLNKLFTPISGEQLFGDDVYNVPFEFVLPEDYRDYGTYSFTQADYKYKAGKPENYDVRFSGTANIVINKADIVIPNEEAGIEGDFVAPTAAELTYNGTERELLDAGEVITTYQYEDIMDKPELIGTMKYATAENGEYTTAIPKATDAGTYAVWYKVEGDKNHNDTQATKIEVTIGKKALASTMFALSATTAQYKKDNLMPTVTATDLNGETNIIKASDYVVKAYDSENNEVKGNKLINVGTYTLKFTPSEKSNYSDGNAQATFEITPRPAQAVAYNATKVYDGVAGLGEIKVKFSYTNLIPGDDDAIVAGDGAVYFEKEAKNAGSYPMQFNLAGFVSQNYEVIGVEDTGAQFTITKAPLTVKWKAGAAGFSKAYGEDDPDFDATADNIVLQGAITGEEATIIENTVISRVDDNENVGKYDLQLSALQIKDEKDQWVDAHVFDNYNYNFENPIKQIFEIVPADIAVSVVPQSKTYDGVKVTTFDVTAEDLVVTHLKGGEAKGVVFTTLPTATVTGGAENAGEYEVTLAGGVATNYNIKTYLTSTYTIDPVMVNAQFNNTPVAVEGDEVSVILGKVQWTVKADKEANQSIVDDNIGKFNLYYQGLVETKNKVDYIAEGEDGQDALILVYEGEENPANFEFINATGDLNIGEAGIAVALDDSKAIETTAANKANVTFTQNRPVAEDTWQACVLPFTVSIEKLSDTFGYAAVDLFDKDRTNENEVHFSLQVSGSIEAGTPFLFKTNNNTNFTDVMFEGVDVVSTASLDANRIVVDDKGDGADATGIKFIGTFEKVGIWGEDFRYLSGGTWYNAAKYEEDKPANIKPLRAYLDMNGKASARIFIDEPDGTTSIMSVSNFNNMITEGWYTIEGKKLDQAPTQKGVYIQNGKKVVIK